MARKVFLSVLGTGFYDKYNYGIGEFCTNSPTRFIQTATMEFLGVKEWNKNDAIYILMTQNSRKDNWETSESGTRLKKGATEAEVYKGLSDEIKAMELPCINDIDISIPDGQNEDEMWQIFDKLFSIIEDEDELYVDLTHSFRYIPMLMMVFCNYAKFLKHITVKSITYGNIFNKREDGAATINDITPLSILQDWTSAADIFLSTGNVDKISKIYLPEIRNRLRLSEGGDTDAKALNSFINKITTIVKDIKSCQGKSLIEANNIKNFKESLQAIENIDKPQPFRPILESIEQSFSSFDTEENIKNGIASAKWCADNGLYQQAVTLLQESLISHVCRMVNLDWKVLTNRELISGAIHIKARGINEENWKIPNEMENGKAIIIKVIGLPQIEDISNKFGLLADLRNEFNHAAMLDKNQFSADNLIKKITDLTEEFYHLTYSKTL